ncbi:hypothetical protein KW797_00155 [Candidatus Parcubacteria bacterium]|nr:hypothetical protein [Candidatus Parcubacteria bacterium]
MSRVPSTGFCTAPNCAWRALYCYVRGRQLFHIGFDPTVLRLFAGFGWRSGGFTVPHLRWTGSEHPVHRFLYSLQSRVLHRLDGRF